MERGRLAWLVAIAFFAGAFGAALALSDGSPLASLGREPVDLRISIENVGAHDAQARLEVGRAAGGSLADWRFSLAAGGRASFEEPRLPDERLVARATVEVSGGIEAGYGDRTLVLDPTGCAGGALLRVVFVVDTTNGVGFREARAAC